MALNVKAGDPLFTFVSAGENAHICYSIFTALGITGRYHPFDFVSEENIAICNSIKTDMSPYQAQTGVTSNSRQKRLPRTKSFANEFQKTKITPKTFFFGAIFFFYVNFFNCSCCYPCRRRFHINKKFYNNT